MKLMPRISRLSAGPAALALSVLMSTVALPSAAQTIGVNAAIRNQVQMKTAADAALRPAVLREAVHLGDAVASGPNSTLQVLLRDKSTFTVGANARMTFDRFVYDPNRGTSEVAASVTKGAFRFMSGKTQPNARKTINTPVASIGVRGTIVEGVVGPDAVDVLNGQPGLPAFTGNPDEAALVVLRGPSRKTSGFDTPGLVDVTAGGVTTPLEHPGQAAVVFGGAVFGPFELSDSAFDRLNSLLRTTPVGPGDSQGGDLGSAAVAAGDVLTGGDFGGETVYTPDSLELSVPPEQESPGGPNNPGGPTDNPGGPTDNPGGPTGP
jgi:hypothetical protein